MDLSEGEASPVTSPDVRSAMRDADWAASPIGPPEGWSAALKTVVELILPAEAQIVLFWGPEFVALYNDAYAPTIGDKHPRALGRPACENWSELWDDLGPLLQSVRDTGKTVSARDRPFYIERHGGHGEQVFFDISYSIVPDAEAEGGIGGVLCLVSETTARVQAEAAAREAEREIATMTDALPVLVSYIGADARYRFVNRTYEEWFGHAREEIRGRHMRDVLGEEAFAQLQPAIARVLSGERFGFDTRVSYKDGGPRDVHIDYVPRTDDRGDVLGWYAHVQDVSERVRAEAALRESEARFRNMADHAPVMLWVTDASGACTYLNKEWYKFTGQTVDEAEGFGWLDATHPDDKAEAERIFLDANAAQRPFRLEYRLRRHDGAYRWAIDAAGPRFGPDGAFLGYVGSVIDIDERRAFEESLRASETRLREQEQEFHALADNMPALCWMAHADGHIYWYNRRWYDYTGTSADTQEGWGWESVHDPEWLPRVVERWRASLETGEPFEMTFPLRGADGVFRPFLTRVSPVRDESGQVVRWFGANVDVTEQMATAEALQASESRLRFLGELDEALREVRDPVDAMAAATRLLCERLDTSRCAYADVDDNNDRFFIRADFSAPGVASSVGEYSLDLFGPRAAADMRQGRTLVVRDVAGELEPGAGREMFQAIGIDAIICCPLVKDGRLRAMMAVHNAAARDWRPDEIALVETVVERCWAQIERVGAEARLRESEERYRTLFTSIESGFCVVEVNPEGRIDYRVVEANPAFYEQTGFEEAVLGQWLRQAAPDLEDQWFERYGRIARTGVAERFEEGSNALGRWFDVYAFRVGRPEENRVAILFNDISARRTIENALRDSEAKFHAIANSIDQMVWSTRPDGFHDYYNDRWYEYTGVPYGSTDGAAWNDMFHPDDQDRAWSVWRHSLETGDPYHIEYRLRHRSGQYRWVIGRAQCVRGEDGQITRWFGTCTDIHDLKEAEGQLRELNDTLEDRVEERTAELETAHEALRQSQKMEAMGQLTGGVAHDFNNLLTPIVGALDLLQRKGLGGEREQRLIAGAAQSADRAKTLVQRLLAFARRQPLQMVPVDVPQLVDGMAELIASTTGPQIKVVVNVADGMSPAMADPNQLEMALLNLAVNARDAMPDGGTLRISADAARADGVPGLAAGEYIRMSVADTGVGMNEDTLKRAVEPFFSTKGVGRGTGLGLSMVHGLASQLGGALTITSKPGLGTNIELWLPKATAAVAAAEAPRETIVVSTRGIVLLVDDEELVRLSTADMLEDMGYGVIEASSSEEALALVERGEKFDLLVTDHLMPGMTGSDLARRIRDLRGDLPVLVVSGYAESEGLAPDLARLTKPFRKDDLAESLAGVTAA